MPETTIVCPKCKQELVTEDSVQGVSIDCPSCGTSFVVAMTSPPVAPPPAAPIMPAGDSVGTTKARMSSIVRAGWICFGIGVGLMCVMFIFPIWIPLLMGTLVLAIIATAKKLKGALLLLVLSLVVPPVLGIFMFLVILGGCVAAVDSEMKKQGMQMPKQPPAGFHSPLSGPGARP